MAARHLTANQARDARARLSRAITAIQAAWAVLPDWFEPSHDWRKLNAEDLDLLIIAIKHDQEDAETERHAQT
jgi:hypothetical protein